MVGAYIVKRWTGIDAMINKLGYLVAFAIGLAVLWGVTVLLDNNPILLILYTLFVGYTAGSNSKSIKAMCSSMVDADHRDEATRNMIYNLEDELKDEIEAKANEVKAEIKEYISLNYPDRKNLGAAITDIRNDAGLPEKRFFD
ncbi:MULTISPECIES: hypothetical protein [Psychrobacter]|uniref:hypothetical protein n=1 Tax=Psychrobacter TaxID=497 RepID=UPI000EDF8309|nr:MULTISPECIES: hypothetical protein [Psychrobacter]HCH27018.1 hypothetical protein [Psychrobacter sp.]